MHTALCLSCDFSFPSAVSVYCYSFVCFVRFHFVFLLKLFLKGLIIFYYLRLGRHPVAGVIFYLLHYICTDYEG